MKILEMNHIKKSFNNASLHVLKDISLSVSEGDFFGFILPLAVVLFILIILHPYAPKVLNNVGFAYLTVACIDTTALATHLPQFFITFIVGSVLFNGVCVLLMKLAKALAVKSAQKENA